MGADHSAALAGRTGGRVSISMYLPSLIIHEARRRNASATIVSSRRGWLVVVEGRAVEVRSADDIERCFEQGEGNEQSE